MFRKTKMEPPKPDHAFAFCQASFLMTFVTGGIPRTGSRHITNSMDMNLSKLQEILEDRGAWRTTVHGVAESGPLSH